jgi:hypothetical protein
MTINSTFMEIKYQKGSGGTRGVPKADYFSITISKGQVMASCGQTNSQLPHHLSHPEHLCNGLNFTILFSNTKALQEQTPTHIPHPSHFS